MPTRKSLFKFSSVGQSLNGAPSTFVYTKIANALFLPLETRALFCAARMAGYAWIEQTRFFGNDYRTLCLRKKLSGENDPLYPKTFSQRRFYRNFSSSYESQLPQKLAESINLDNVAQFNITLTLCNRQLSKNLVLHLLLRGVINILKANLSAIDRFLSLEKTVLFCASSVPVPVATHLLSAIENATPGCMKKHPTFSATTHSDTSFIATTSQRTAQAGHFQLKKSYSMPDLPHIT